MPKTPDYYETLGVPATATPAEIKAAYRALAKKLHPDLGGSAQALAGVNEAHDVLSDATRRAAYDLDRRPGRGAGKPSAAQPATKNEPNRPRQRVTVALCEFCETLNRVKDDPDFVPATCGNCHRALGKAGHAPAPAETVMPKAAAEPQKKPADSDSYAQILGDAARQVFSGAGLPKTLTGLPGTDKIAEGLRELTDYLAKRGPHATADEKPRSREEELDAALKRAERKGP